jgi:hypothetical protein
MGRNGTVCKKDAAGEPEAYSFPRYSLKGKGEMVAFWVSVIEYVVNVAVSVGTDGDWKTAGLVLTQAYWSRVHKTTLVSLDA